MATNTTAQRAGIPSDCLAHIRTAETHVRRLFFRADGQLRAAIKGDQSLPLRCLNGAFGHQGEMWKAARQGDASETLRLARLWYQAVQQALQRFTAPAAVPRRRHRERRGQDSA